MSHGRCLPTMTSLQDQATRAHLCTVVICTRKSWETFHKTTRSREYCEAHNIKPNLNPRFSLLNSPTRGSTEPDHGEDLDTALPAMALAAESPRRCSYGE